MDDDEPLWLRILGNEILWLVIAAIVILTIAFLLATSGDPPEESRYFPATQAGRALALRSAS